MGFLRCLPAEPKKEKRKQVSVVKRDGEHIVIKVPQDDLDSMVRWVAHNVVNKTDRVKELANNIVYGELQLQDVYVQSLIETLGIDEWALVYDGAEALKLCDELADTIYDEPKEKFGPMLKASEKPTLRLVTICVDCQKGFVKGEAHDCLVK
ncbi:hypothetical protein UFOVP688_37 [uncultured Caudovirales phage]|uniref:Uncharacterized protein n=1 Tax=uncultured Caudovirales phage TaxID=2100421 RepID=A0A6J5NIR3_9CAUD|nr:hypothetical protein UFOVP688_37 [uncultured Caudovirales phage]